MGIEFDFSKVRDKMQELSKKMANEVTDECLDEASKPIITEMRNNVPKDTRELEGSLGEIKRTGTGVNRKVTIGINSNDRKIIERGYYQEYGKTTMIGKKWMKRSFKIAKSEANKRIIEVLKRRIK